MSTNINDEFDVEVPVANKGELLDSLHAMSKRSIELNLQVEDLEEQLKLAKAELNDLRTKKMPDIMIQLRMTDFTQNNQRFVLADFISGNIPKEDLDKRRKALDWLINHDGSDLIKTEVKVNYGREEYDKAVALLKKLEKSGIRAKLDESVHVQTLWAFARERMENGEPLDAEVLGLTIGKQVKMK